MNILNKDNKLFYLKSVNLNEASNTVFLFFRQEALFFLNSDSSKYLKDYQNVLLILGFEDLPTASENFRLLKDLYLDDVISIEAITPNEIAFIGRNDLVIKVDRYIEQKVDQFTEDWIERHKHASESYFEAGREVHKLNILVDEIKVKLLSAKKEHPDNTSICILFDTIVEKIENLKK